MDEKRLIACPRVPAWRTRPRPRFSRLGFGLPSEDMLASQVLSAADQLDRPAARLCAAILADAVRALSETPHERAEALAWIAGADAAVTARMVAEALGWEPSALARAMARVAGQVRPRIYRPVTGRATPRRRARPVTRGLRF